jgi:hypothetical protein
MKSSPTFLLAPWAVFLLAGCYEATGSRHDTSQDVAAEDPAVTDNVVPPDIVQDRPYDPVPDPIWDPVPPDMETQCTTDDDCTIVLLQDRCCSPDPIAIPRALAGSNPCYHELGQPWVDSPGCPQVDCFWCPPISKRAYGARCEGGVCVPVEDSCTTGPSPAPVASVNSRTQRDGGGERYRGQLVQVRGQPSLGPNSCGCCDDCDCACFDQTVQQALDCSIALMGSVCGEVYACGGTECSPDCSPRLLQNYSTYTGYVVDDSEGAELWVTRWDDDCPPLGRNPEGASCTPMGDDDCAEGLVCFYWGDVLDNCIATCMPFGTECTFDTDCDEGDVCHQGYCMWCCPG